MKNKLIAVDFDGTCVKSDFPTIIEDIQDAVETLKWLSETCGYKLILWTCREDHPTNINKRYLYDAIKWFEERDIELTGINEVPIEYDDFRVEWKKPARKICADYYIDDKNIGGFIGWKKIREIFEVEMISEYYRINNLILKDKSMTNKPVLRQSIINEMIEAYKKEK